MNSNSKIPNKLLQEYRKRAELSFSEAKEGKGRPIEELFKYYEDKLSNS